MKLFLKALLLLAALLSTVVAWLIWSKYDEDKRLRVPSPTGEWLAMGLPFVGKQPHPLDNNLRVFLISGEGPLLDLAQTSLPVTLDTRLEWIPQAEPPSFRLIQRSDAVVTWNVVANALVCVKGHEHLAPDPYAQRATTASERSHP